MADLASLPTQVGDVDGDTGHLNAVWGSIKSYREEIARLRLLLQKSEQEVTALRMENERLKRGEGIFLQVGERRFQVVPEQAQGTTWTITDGWVNDQGNGQVKNPLEDSFLLAKE